MSDFNLPPEPESIVSVTDRIRKVALDAAAAAVHFLGETAIFVGGENTVTLVGADLASTCVEIHAVGLLCSASDGKRVIIGCDNGQLISIDAAGHTDVLATDAKRRWIDNVALHPDGAIAWSAGKTAFVRSPKLEDKFLDVPSTVGGLAFAPKGLRLAIAHYNGVTLWFPNMAGKPEFLEWKGSHLGVTFSADNRFLITSMHEAALHGWRLADVRHMRMTGYPSRVRSMSWNASGKFLATSGSDSVILWPFASKDGPMGKEPTMLAPLQAKATVVACHPKEEIFAVGYSDGTVLMVRIEDGAEILVRRNAGQPISALSWNAKGSLLAFASEDGDAGLMPLE